MINAMQEVERRGGRFALYGVSGPVRTIMEIARLEQVFEVVRSNDFPALKRPTTQQFEAAAAVQIRETTQELTVYLSKHPELLYHQSPRDFELVVAEILRAMGYEVKHVGRPGDKGRDILATMMTPLGRMLLIVQCKRQKPGTTISPDLVKSLLFIVDRQETATWGLFATTAKFGPELLAMQKQYQNRLTLADYERLKQWLVQYGTWTETGDSSIWIPVSPAT